MCCTAAASSYVSHRRDEPAKIHGAIDKILSGLKLAHFPTCSSLPSRFCLDHSHCPVLAPATLAALPSTPRFPIATCSMSLLPSAPFCRLHFAQPAFAQGYGGPRSNRKFAAVRLLPPFE